MRLDPPLGYYEVNEVMRLDRSRTGDLVEGEEVRVHGICACACVCARAHARARASASSCARDGNSPSDEYLHLLGFSGPATCLQVRVCRDVGAKGIPNTNGMTGVISGVWSSCETAPRLVGSAVLIGPARRTAPASFGERQASPALHTQLVRVNR